MKHTKFFFALLVLAAAVLAFGCNNANSKKSADKVIYDNFITSLENAAKSNDVSAKVVEASVAQSNESLKTYKYQIKDADSGKDIKQGTKAEALRGRFKLEKTK